MLRGGLSFYVLSVSSRLRNEAEVNNTQETVCYFCQRDCGNFTSFSSFASIQTSISHTASISSNISYSPNLNSLLDVAETLKTNVFFDVVLEFSSCEATVKGTI